MSKTTFQFSALETLRVVPVTGCANVIAVAKRLHALGTTHAFRVLGGILTSVLLEKEDQSSQLNGYVHNELWVHTTEDVVAQDGRSRIASVVHSNNWDKVDFMVLLTVYRGPDDGQGKLEARVAINSADEAPTATTDAFYKFVLSLCGLCKGRPLYFKGIEDYLLEKLPGVRYLTRIRCLNYSMDCRHWEESFQQGSFSESAVAQKLDLQMSGIQSSDLTTMRDMNVIRYDREYLQHCCPTSSCIRRASDRAPVAWIMCHADLEMGAMLTTDGYRRRGLAKYIVHDLGTKMMQVFADRISLLYSDDPREYDFKLQMVTELTNSNTRRLFEQLGFRPVANVSWAECVFDHQQYQAQQRGNNPRL